MGLSCLFFFLFDRIAFVLSQQQGGVSLLVINSRKKCLVFPRRLLLTKQLLCWSLDNDHVHMVWVHAGFCFPEDEIIRKPLRVWGVMQRLWRYQGTTTPCYVILWWSEGCMLAVFLSPLNSTKITLSLLIVFLINTWEEALLFRHFQKLLESARTIKSLFPFWRHFWSLYDSVSTEKEIIYKTHHAEHGRYVVHWCEFRMQCCSSTCCCSITLDNQVKQSSSYPNFPLIIL